VTTPYRTDLDALRETKEALENELSATKQREAALAGELHQVEERIKTRTRLPMLDNVRVASPCNASWDEMLGDDRVRFCTSCEKNVFNLSAMPREAAERLLAERMNGELCVRFYQRADGTVMTQDCPVGVTKKRRKLAVLAAAGAGAMALAATSSLFTRTMGKPGLTATMGDVAPCENTLEPAVMGSAAPPAYTAPPVQPTSETPHVAPTPMQGQVIKEPMPMMGKPMVKPAMMGRRAR
jgi:hypothetical protein